MTLFSAYPESTAPDSDDSYLVLVDGAVRRVTGASTKTLVLPAGHVDANDYTATTTTLINSADALTGWTGANLTSAATIATSSKTEGTGSVRAILKLEAGVASKIYYTPPGTQSITGRSLVAFDITFFPEGATHAAAHEFEARVCDGTALINGNINAQNLAGTPYGDVADPNAAWTTIVLPLTGLANITSIGVLRVDTATGGASDRVDSRIDNVRFLSESKLDAALASSASAIAVVPPTYVADANQVPLYLPTGKGVIDAAKGVYSKQNNEVWLHDYLAHVVGAETGLTDVQPAINRIIADAPPGSVIHGTPGATYRFDADMTLRDLRDLTIDFTGSTLFITYKSNSQFWNIVGCRNITMIGGTWFGYYNTPINGSILTTVTGTPTTSGTTKLLDALNEEVQIPDHTNWLRASHFARHLPQQLGLAPDGLPPRCYWSFVLSDSAQIASDCVISVYDDDTDVLLTSSTLTLTASPTTYRISYTPSDLRQRHRVTVRKATATANTITITSGIHYGENKYAATFDVGSCVLIDSSSYIACLDMWMEGFSGDAVQISDLTVNHVTVRGCVSRACRRQGMSFNAGTDMVIENCVVAECGRSGIDCEPAIASWYTRRVTIRDITIYNTVNYGLALGNWARNFDYVIDGIDLYESRLGLIFGGFNGGLMQNMRNWSALNYGAGSDFDITGSNMVVRNLRSKVAVSLHTTTTTFDDGTGTATYTPTNNTIHSNTVQVISGLGIEIVAGYRLDSLSNITVTASATSHAVVFTGYTIPTTYAVDVETNWNSGFPYITAKTSAGFTINFPTAAPGDGSGRISWAWSR